MSRFLFVGKEGMACSLAYRMLTEGVEVGYYMWDKDSLEHLDGMGIEKFGSLNSALSWAGGDAYLIADDESDMSKLRESGWKVCGGNKLTERIERDRVFQSKLARELGVPIPNFHEVHSVDEAIAYIKKHPDMWCLKQQGPHAPKEFGYVGKDDDGEDTIAQLEWIKQHPLGSKMKNVMLQEGAPGIEFAVGAFWLGRDWLRTDSGEIFTESNREHKKMLNGDLGISTGEMGTVMKFGVEDKLFSMMLDPLTPWLLENCPDVVLNIDANCGVVSEDEAWLYEWTPRLGYPAHALQEFLLEIPSSEFYANIIDRRQGNVPYKDGWCVGTVMGAGDFPHELTEDTSHTFKNQPVDFEWSENAMPEYVKYDKKDTCYRIADDYAWISTVCFVDNDIKKANEKCVDVLKQIEVRAPVFRTDIGDKFVAEELSKLERWGYVSTVDHEQSGEPEQNRRQTLSLARTG